jgi:hypothetical protein
MEAMKLRQLAASMLIAFAPLAYAATAATSSLDAPVAQLNTSAENKGQTQVATKIATSFGDLAGSDANTLKLVQALRTGTAVTLTTPTTGTGTGTGTGTSTTTTITPPTGKMGWGNVFISLALAKDTLARAGITDPTTAQLQAALTGGDIVGADGKTVTLKGVLQMRADGMGWGQIAQASGTKLGPVVSSIKSAHKSVAALPASGSSTPTTTTAAGTTTTKSSSKGVTTAAGTAGTSTTKGNSGSKGVVTASGASAGTVTHGNSGHVGGKGVVTAAGGSAGASVTHGNSGNKGVGVVTAGGGSATGVTSATGNAGGNGNGKGNAGGNGKGKGG